MFSPDDTIVAIATPPGRGGIGVVRVSGPNAAQVAGAMLDRREPARPRQVTLARVLHSGSGESTAIDRVLVTYFPSPGSYTGQDVVEISGHGSPVLLRQIVCAAMRAGARLAEPGEFTLRAFLNGRLDLVQAEAVGDLINAATPLQARVAFDLLEGTLTAAIGEIDEAVLDLVARLEASLDFPEEGYHFVEAASVAGRTEEIAGRVSRLLAGARRGRLIREGRQVAILGKPNVGKSTVFNYLVGSERAIVTALAGTTRDLLTEVADIEGVPVTLIDTAGIRDTADVVESEGVTRARGALAVADLVLLVLDRSCPLDGEDTALLRESASSQTPGGREQDRSAGELGCGRSPESGRVALHSGFHENARGFGRTAPGGGGPTRRERTTARYGGRDQYSPYRAARAGAGCVSTRGKGCG